MKIRILSVGTRMPSWVEQGYRDYDQRIKSILPIELVEIPLAQRGKSKRSKNADVAKTLASEAEAIKKHLRPREKVIVLDVLGKSLSTPSLAKKLADWQMQGDDIALIIGGPDGLDPSLLQAGYESWSLSELTLPHPIVRIVLIEQLYRGLMINANHPYHRE